MLKFCVLEKDVFSWKNKLGQDEKDTGLVNEVHLGRAGAKSRPFYFLDAFASPEAEEVSSDGDPGEWWHCC